MNRRDRLFLWSVARHTPDDRKVDEMALQAACDRLKFPPERVMWILKNHPGDWNREMAKRQARIDGVPPTPRQLAQVQSAVTTNLKVWHPRKVRRMHRKGVPI